MSDLAADRLWSLVIFGGMVAFTWLGYIIGRGHRDPWRRGPDEWADERAHWSEVVDRWHEQFGTREEARERFEARRRLWEQKQ